MSFLRSTGQLAGSTIVSQSILLASLPLLGRLYSPTDFAALAVYLSLVVISANLATLKLEQAIVLVDEDKAAIQLIAAIVKIVAALSGVAFIGLALAAMNDVFPGDTYIVVIPFGIAAGVLQGLIQQLSARKQNYRHYAQSLIVGAGCNVLFSSCLSGLSLPISGLVLGHLAGAVATVSYGAYFTDFVNTVRKGLSLMGKTSIVATLSIYRAFPLHVLPGSLIASIGQNAWPIVLAITFEKPEVGAFALAFRFLLVPASMFAGSAGEAMRADLAKRARLGSPIRGYVRRAALYASIAIPIACTGLVVVGRPAIPFALGAGYDQVVKLLLPVALLAAATTLAQIFQSPFLVCGRTGVGAKLQYAQSTLTLATLLIASQSVSIGQAIALAGAVFSALAVIQLFMALRVSHDFDEKQLLAAEMVRRC